MSSSIDEWCTIPNAVIHKSYECVLCDVDIAKNSNKFYIMQIVETGPSFVLYTRYGRIGEKGVISNDRFDVAWSAIQKFCSKYYAKTGNKWDSGSFIEKKGKYIKMDIEHPTIETATVDPSTDPGGAKMTRTLPPEVEDIIKTISNKETMKTTLKRMNVDTERLPLGKLKKGQIMQAEDVLSLIKQYISKEGIDSLKMFGANKDFAQKRVEELSSKFWTLIPRASKRTEKPVVISTLEILGECVDMVDSIKSIEVATKLIAHNTGILDVYDSLHIELSPVAADSEIYAMIEDYIKNTHAPTHYYTLTLEGVFAVKKESTATKDAIFTEMDAHYLLFHGSRSTNFMGIFSEGLRIPRATQVINGSVLGQGIYFADSISKSFNYCHADKNQIGYVLMCEVALGTYEEVIVPNSNPLPTGFDSRYAAGSLGPNEDEYNTISTRDMEDDLLSSSHLSASEDVPLAERTSSSRLNASEDRQTPVEIDLGEETIVTVPSGKLVATSVKGGSFQYNEYVIYNSNQYKIRYLLKLRRS
jgi:poly [ADP-ribose] polymerase